MALCKRSYVSGPAVNTMSSLGDVFWMRTWWTADVHRATDMLWLAPRQRFRHTVIWRSTLAVFSDTLVPGQLQADLGDAFLLCGPSINETMVATVTAIGESRLRVALSDELAPATTVVQLTPLNLRSRTTRKRKAA